MEDVADSLNDAVCWPVWETTVKALWVGACESEIIYPSIVGIFETALPSQ